MLFIMGINQRRKDFDYSKMVICSTCGAYGRMQVFMTYTVLTLFFIPIFKWSKKYYVQMSCCGNVYEIDSELGSRIEKGEEVELSENDLSLVGGKMKYNKRCMCCGYETDEDFSFCPKCGKELV